MRYAARGNPAQRRARQQFAPQPAQQPLQPLQPALQPPPPAPQPPSPHHRHPSPHHRQSSPHQRHPSLHQQHPSLHHLHANPLSQNTIHISQNSTTNGPIHPPPCWRSWKAAFTHHHTTKPRCFPQLCEQYSARFPKDNARVHSIHANVARRDAPGSTTPR